MKPYWSLWDPQTLPKKNNTLLVLRIPLNPKPTQNNKQTLLVLRILADDPPKVFSVVASEHGVLEDDLTQGRFSTTGKV